MKIKGGLRQKNTNITSFQAVMNMINLQGAQLSHIAYKSLSGFIFKLDIPHNPTGSEFFGLNEKSHAFNVPIYSLIIKFAIISDVKERLRDLFMVDEAKRYEKRKETLEDFQKECEIQQQVYLKTVIPSGNPVCLAVVDFSHFDSVSTPIFLEKLLKLARTNKARNMLAYLHDNVKNHRRLGMITMELADGYYEIANVTNRDELAEKMMYSISQLFISFTKLKIMNYDSHMGNILTKPNSAKTFHIDFGRTINFNDGKRRLEDAFPKLGNKIIMDYNSISGNDYETEFRAIMEIDIVDLYAGGRTDEIVVIERMHRIIKFLAYVDYVVNMSYFSMTGFERPQMIEMLKIIYGRGNMSDIWDPTAAIYKNPTTAVYKKPNFVLDQRSIPIFQEVIVLVKKMSEVDTTLGRQSKSGSAIEDAKRENRLFHINKTESYDRSSLVSVIQVRANNSNSPSRRNAITQQVIHKKKEGFSFEQRFLFVVVVGFILKKLLSGGSRSRKSRSRGGNNFNKREKIIKIVTEKLKEYNCGIEFDLSKDKIELINENELNKYIEANEIEIIDKPEHSKDTCNFETLKMPPIEELLTHVKKQLAVNNQIIGLRKTRRSLSKSSESSSESSIKQSSESSIKQSSESSIKQSSESSIKQSSEE